MSENYAQLDTVSKVSNVVLAEEQLLKGKILENDIVEIIDFKPYT